ncbi:MAG: amino acid ABC transporter permease [Proteobacteria bacterium]|nr:amino acid ABC transporter permease [Pseudomonadota bacterium]
MSEPATTPADPRLAPSEKPQVAFWRDPEKRGYFFQALLFLVVAFLGYEAIANAVDNLTRQKMASGFGFLNQIAGFDINQTLISYSNTSTYGRAFFVGLFNTFLVAGLGIVLATLIGFSIGVARLSSNWLVAKLAAFYVEIVRNTPLLLQLLFWYFLLINMTPQPRDSVSLGLNTYLNNRGLFLPQPVLGNGFTAVLLTFVAGLIGAWLYRRRAHALQEATGQQSPVGLVSLGLIVGLPLAAFFAAGMPLSFNPPELGRFNIRGGVQVFPEFVALLTGLTIYTAAFIAENVRAGIQAVSKGQTEAAYALGMRPGPTLDLIIIPQAMRVIIPPLTNQYLNLTKNSTLAVAIGYPDLWQVFAGTVLNQTNQAIEVIAISMAVYLFLSITTSLAMNWYNSRKALVER